MRALQSSRTPSSLRKPFAERSDGGPFPAAERLGPGGARAVVGDRLADLETGNPAAYLPDLAMLLWEVGWACGDSGSPIQAGLAAVSESVDLHEVLATVGDNACRFRVEAVRPTNDSLLLTMNGATTSPEEPSLGS